MAKDKQHKIQLITELDSIKDVFNTWSYRMRKQNL